MNVVLDAKEHGIPVYTIAVESKVSDIQKFLDKKAPGLPVLVDRDGKATEKPFSMDYVPTLVLVNHEGKVIHHGELKAKKLGSELRKLQAPPDETGDP